MDNTNNTDYIDNFPVPPPPKKMKPENKRALIIGAVLGALIALSPLIYGVFISCAPSFTFFIEDDAVFMIKTRDEMTDEIFNYKVDRFGNKRECERFEPNSSLKTKKTNSLSILNNQDCRDLAKKTGLSKSEQNKLYKRFIRACYLAEHYEKHDIWPQRIFVHNDTVYVSALYNVNLHTPYHLFRYDNKSDKVVELCVIENEEILDIRM